MSKTYQVTVRKVVAVTYEVRADGFDDAVRVVVGGIIPGDEVVACEVVDVTEDTQN